MSAHTLSKFIGSQWKIDESHESVDESHGLRFRSGFVGWRGIFFS
jgi:hypothetical protein